MTIIIYKLPVSRNKYINYTIYRYLDTQKAHSAYTPQTKPRSFVIFDGKLKHRFYVQQAAPARYGPFVTFQSINL